MFKCNKFNDILASYHENKLSHAFLLETNDIDKCYEDVLLLLKNLNCPNIYEDNCNYDCNLCYLIDSGNLPSLVTIDPLGNNIKKEQILDMMEKFSYKPIYSKFNSYIVRKCDFFNQYSANTLLKFLEEPQDYILGFFITNNKMNVISTVRSRCQEWSIYYNDELGNNYSDDSVKLFNEYINSIYDNKDDVIYNYTTMKGIFSDRTEWINFFTEIIYYLVDVHDDKIIVSNGNRLADISKANLVGVISLLKDILKYLKSNGNIELILDKFVIEMRKYYE